MKKFFLIFALALLVLPGFSQTMIIIQGTVTDNQNNLPIPNHEVSINTDSTSGFPYYSIVLTNTNGFYADTIFPTGGVMPMTVFVDTWDCQQVWNHQVITINPAILTYTADFSICNTPNPCQASFTSQQLNPLYVQFFDTSVGSSGTWLWSFGDGATSTQMDPVHTYSQPGLYAVNLTIGALGTPCYSTATQNIYVWDSIPGGCQASFYIIPDSLNSLNTFHFMNMSQGNPSTFIWNFGDGQTQTVTFPGNPNVIHTYAQPGTYTPCLTISSPDSSCFDMTCQTLVVGPPPGCQAAFTYYSDSSTTSNTIHFIDLSIGNNLTWNWAFGDGTFSTEQNPVHTYPAPGMYGAMLTITSQNPSCTSTYIDTIYVGSGSGCQANFSYLVNPVTGNNTVYFTDLSFGNPTTWLWSFGDGTSASVQNPTHAFAIPGTYTVCLTITGANCISTFCQDIVVQDSTNYQQIYGQVFAGNFPIAFGVAMIFSVDTTGTYTPFVDVCPIDSNGWYYFPAVPQGDYYVMAIPLTPGGFLPTYYGNTISWEQATVITLGTANNPYNINVVPSDQMTPGPGSASGQINMGDVSTAMLDKINMIIMNEQGTPIGFTTLSTTGAFTFPSLAYGTYYLHPEMPGITSDVIKIVLTTEKPHADVVMTFAGNSIMGIRDEATLVNSWNIYPNPVVDNLNVAIDMKQGTQADALIYNVSGQIMAGSEITLNSGANKFSFPLASIPNGVYTLRISSKDGMNINVKFIKIR